MLEKDDDEDNEGTEDSSESGSSSLKAGDESGEDVSPNNELSGQDGVIILGDCNDQCSGINQVTSTGGENNLSAGGAVKSAGNVVRKREENSSRNANMNCRVDAFGRMVERFDDKKKKWVCEMGFGGLLHLAYKQLPRTLCYWLVTRVDPLTEMFIAPDGREFRLSKHQVTWVLGIKGGKKSVPRKATSEEMEVRIKDLEEK